jgi:hypothetical protein
VVTGFDYQLYPVGPEIVAGAMAWRGEDTAAVLEKFREIALGAPPELACVAVLRPAPPAPWLPKEIHGKPIAVLGVCHTGPIEEAERWAGTLKSFGSPVGDVLMRRTYVSQQSMFDATQPKGRRYYWKSEYMPDLAPEMLSAAASHALTIPSPHSAMLLFPIDGALNRLPDSHSAVGNRDARFLLNIASAWEKPEDDDENIEWARKAWRDMRRFSTGGTYINFLTEEEGSDRIQAAYRGNLDRLIEVKTAWDPTNFFRANKNIAPRKAAASSA